MNLSIFERVFALRDKARDAKFSADTADLSNLESGELSQASSLQQQKLASELMAEADLLRELADNQ